MMRTQHHEKVPEPMALLIFTDILDSALPAVGWAARRASSL